MIRNALAVAWKDLQVLLKDRGWLAVLFLMPLMFASILGQVFGGGTPEISVYLVNHDTGRFGPQVANILNDIEVLSIEELDTVEEADQKIADGEALAAIVIPEDFSADVDAFDPVNDPADVQVVVDPTQSEYGNIVTGIVNQVMMWVTYQGEIQHGIRAVMDESGAFDQMDEAARKAVETQQLGVIMTQLQRASTDPLVSVRSEDPEGVERIIPDNAYSYTMPAYAVMFAFFIIGAIGGTLLTEKEEGTLRRLLASPVHRGSIILGKMLAYMLVVGLQVLVIFGVGTIFFGIPLGDSPLGLLLLTLALALAATSLGMLVAAVSRTRSQANNIGTVLSIVMGALGGSIVPIVKSNPLYLPSQIIPHSHAIKGYTQLMTEGAGVSEILPQVGVLAGLAVLFFLIAMWRIRFE